MCTALIWFNPHADWPLCVAFNRDERYSRRELAPRLIEGSRAVCLCPLDEHSGGTWLGVNSFGLTMCIVNDVVRSKQSEGSRGLWLIQTLLSCETVDEVNSVIRQSWSPAFQASYLLVADIHLARVHRLGDSWSFRDLDAGFHTLCDSTGLEENERSTWQRRSTESRSPPETYGEIRPALAEHVSTSRISETTCCHSKRSGTISSQFIRWDSKSRLSNFYYLDAPPCSSAACPDYAFLFSSMGVLSRRR